MKIIVVMGKEMKIVEKEAVTILTEETQMYHLHVNIS